MKLSLVYLPLFVLAASVACDLRAPDPPAQPNVAATCANLRKLECPEGNTPDGGDVCEVVLARRDKLHPLPLVCWAAAESVPIMRACPGTAIRCAK